MWLWSLKLKTLVLDFAINQLLYDFLLIVFVFLVNLKLSLWHCAFFFHQPSDLFCPCEHFLETLNSNKSSLLCDPVRSDSLIAVISLLLKQKCGISVCARIALTCFFQWFHSLSQPLRGRSWSPAESLLSQTLAPTTEDVEFSRFQCLSGTNRCWEFISQLGLWRSFLHPCCDSHVMFTLCCSDSGNNPIRELMWCIQLIMCRKETDQID